MVVKQNPSEEVNSSESDQPVKPCEEMVEPFFKQKEGSVFPKKKVSVKRRILASVFSSCFSYSSASSSNNCSKMISSRPRKSRENGSLREAELSLEKLAAVK